MYQEVRALLCHKTSDAIVMQIADTKVLVSIDSIMSSPRCKTNY